MTRTVFGIFALCLLCIYADTQKVIDCDPNSEESAPCGRACEPTCKDSRLKLCKINPDLCPTECRCQRGLVRNEKTDRCITPEQCPKHSCNQNNK